MAEFRGRGGCPCADEETFSGLDYRERACEFKLRHVERLIFLAVSSKVIWGNSVKTYFIAVYFRQLVSDKGLTQSLVTGLYVHHTHQARAGLSL